MDLKYWFLDACTGQICSNQGKCKLDPDVTKGYVCECNPGYTGDDCENGKQFKLIGIAVTFNYIKT